MCAEIQGPAVLGYIYRGFSTLVGPDFGGKLEDTACTTCGKCIDVCPTGALLPKTKHYKPNPGYAAEHGTRCTECGLACHVTTRYAGDTLLQVLPGEENDYNGTDLCYRGRFAWQNTDMNYTAEHAEDLTIPQNTVMHLSPKMSNDMIDAALAFAREHHLDCVSTEVVPDPWDEFPGRHADMADIGRADTLVLAGKNNQVLKARARLAQLKGARLIVIDDPGDPYNRFADLLPASVKELQTHDIQGNTVFIYHRESCSRATRDAIRKKIGGMKNVKVWVNSDHLNTRGFLTHKIPHVDELKAEHVIVFGPVPERVSAEHVIRLPLRPFRIEGTVITDTGEKIRLD